MSRFSWENEWRLQNLKEESYLVEYVMDKTPGWVRFVEHKVPSTLQSTLEKAFGKAFLAVFDKGAALIEKTYRKKHQIKLFWENRKHMEQQGFSRSNVRRFEWQARRTSMKNMAITTVEGIGFGIVGMGVPDIPIFVSVMLKSIYEIAISYGFDYTSQKERLFILKMLDAALASGEVLREKNARLNQLIDRYLEPDGDEDAFVVELQIKRQIDTSAKALSHVLLYGKLLQGKAFIGIIGGIENVTCLRRITRYARLKYKRRFLLRTETTAAEG